MRLLLDEMYSVVVAEQLRARGHDVVSVNDPEFVDLRSLPDADVIRAAMSSGRTLVTENVRDFVLLEAEALDAAGGPALVHTTHRQFPRRGPKSIGRLVVALAALLEDGPNLPGAYFLQPVDDK